MKARTVIGLALVAALLLPATVSASWQATSGSGKAYAGAKSLPAGNAPSASVSNRNVTVSWAAPSGGAPVAGYVVRRYSSGGSAQTVGANCSGVVTGTSCTESGVPGGTWKYSVTPANQNWRGAESAQSTSVTVNPPSLSLTGGSNITSLPSTLSGSIANFIPGQAVTYRLDDPTSGTVLTGSISPTPVQSSGSATVSVTIPNGTSSGSHTVYAIGSNGDQASAGITIANSAITYGATGAAASRTSDGIMTVNYPSGTSANDLLFLVEVNNQNQPATTPSGWTQLADQGTGPPGPPFHFTVWWKLAGAGETSVPLTVTTNGTGATAWVTRYYRPSGSTPDPAPATATVRQGVSGVASTLQPSPDLTTNANNATVISFAAVKAANTLSLSAPQGFTLQNATTATNRAIAVGDRTVPNSGTTPTSPTWSQSGTAAQWAWATVAFN